MAGRGTPAASPAAGHASHDGPAPLLADKAAKSVVEDPGHRVHLAHAFGLLPAAPRDAVVSLWDGTFAYLTGRHVGVCDHSRHRLSFLQRDARGRQITAMAKSANSKLLALAERTGGEEGTVRICILELPKAERLMSMHLGRQEAPRVLKVLQPANRRLNIVGLAFPVDNKVLLSVSAAAPETTVTLWRWEVDKAQVVLAQGVFSFSHHFGAPAALLAPWRVLRRPPGALREFWGHLWPGARLATPEVSISHDIEHPITRLQVHPRIASLFSVSGPGVMRIWQFKAAESILEESQALFKRGAEKQVTVVDHCWVVGAYLCVASESGQAYVFDDGELKQTVDAKLAISSGSKVRRRQSALGPQKLLSSGLGMADRPEPDVDDLKLTALAPWSLGFVVGWNHGYLTVFKVEANSFVEPFGVFRTPEEGTIWSMAAGPEDPQNLVVLSCVADRGDDVAASAAPLLSRSKGTVFGKAHFKPQGPGQSTQESWSLCTFPVGQADVVSSGQLEAFTPVNILGAYGHHTGRVAGMGVSASRNLLATCGADEHLRVWNYPSEDMRGQPNAFTAEIDLVLDEAPVGLAVHPQGFQIAVALQDVVRIYHLTTQTVTRYLMELPLKHPGPVAYSTSGALLAVSSEMEVVLLDPMRAVVIHMFSGRGGHLSPVTQVLFSKDDRLLLSCSGSPHGAIYGWDLETPGKDRRFEHVSKGTFFSSVVHDFRRELVVALTRPDGFLRVVGHTSDDYLDIRPEGPSMHYTCLCLADAAGMLFAGMQTGSVAVFSWPLAEGAQNPRPFTEVALHAKPVAALTTTDSGQLLFSACEGGTVMASEVEIVSAEGGPEGRGGALTAAMLEKRFAEYRYRADERGSAQNRDNERRRLDLQKRLWERGVVNNYAPMSEMVMVPKAYLKELLGDVTELEERLRRTEHDTEVLVEQHELELRDKLAEKRDEMKAEAEMASLRYETLQVQLRQSQEASQAQLLLAREQFEQRLQDLQSQFEAKLSKEYDKEGLLLEGLDRERAQRAEEVRRLEEHHAKEMQALQGKADKQHAGSRAEYDRIGNLLLSDSLRFEEALRQQDSEYSGQLEELQVKYNALLKREKEKDEAAAKENIRIGERYKFMQQQLKELEAEKIEVARERDEAEKVARERTDILMQVKEQLRERERGLKVKDETLARLREQTKHLESFRFVLFHKVRSLEEERDPLEEQVDNLKSNVREMYTEFVREFKRQQKIQRELDEKGNLYNGLQKEVADVRAKLQNLAKATHRLFQDLDVVLHPDTQGKFDRMPQRLADVLERHKKVRQLLIPSYGEDLGLDERPEEEPEPEGLVMELTTHRDLLFRKNQYAVFAATHARSECGQDLRKLISQNTDLINECNTLRGETRQWKRSCDALESQVTALHQKAKRSEAQVRVLEVSAGKISRSESAPGGLAEGAPCEPDRAAEPPRRGGAGATLPQERQQGPWHSAAASPHARRAAAAASAARRQRAGAAGAPDRAAPLPHVGPGAAGLEASLGRRVPPSLRRQLRTPSASTGPSRPGTSGDAAPASL